MKVEDTVMSDEQLESVYQEEYKRAIKFSQEYETSLSAKYYNPDRPADRQRAFNSSHRDTVARAVAKAQAEITAEQIAGEIVEEIRKFCNKPQLYHYRCWGSGMVLIRDEWGDEPTYKCHSYDGDFNCGCRKCPWGEGVIGGFKELQDFERHQNSIIEEIIHSLKDRCLKGD